MPTTQTTVDSAPYGATFDGAKAEVPIGDRRTATAEARATVCAGSNLPNGWRSHLPTRGRRPLRPGVTRGRGSRGDPLPGPVTYQAQAD
jgi:hypothetical protein